MYSTDDVSSQAYLNIPTIFNENTCIIYPKTVDEILKMSQQEYQYNLSLLTLQENEIKEILKKKEVDFDEDEEISPFAYILINAQHSETFLLDIKRAFFTFIREKVTFLFEENLILIGEEPLEKRFLDINNFEDFQNILRIQNRLEIKEKPPEDEDPMARKFRLKREMLAAAKKKINSNKEDSTEFKDLISSLCAYGIGITPFNVGNLSLYAFYDLFERTGAKDSYELDIKSLLAGADSKKVKPKYWIRNLKDK